MTALTFTLESDPSVFVSLNQFADLPKSKIPFGAKTRRVTTNYGGRNEVSTQVLGDDYDDIVLSGVWNDRQTGDFGRAERLSRAFEALRGRAELVRVEWGSYQRWGMLDFRAEYKRRDFVEWTITFDVLYDQPPAFQRVTPYKTPPNDQASEASDQASALKSKVDEAPPETSPDLLLLFLTEVSSIENDISDALSILENVVSSVELTADVARRAASSLYSPIVAIGNMRRRTKAASLDIISTVQGAKAVAVRQWTDDVDVLALTLRVTLAALILELIESIRPAADRRYVVRENETLMTIAANIYGDFSAWQSIADANQLDSAFVATGTVITLPNEV